MDSQPFVYDSVSKPEGHTLLLGFWIIF